MRPPHFFPRSLQLLTKKKDVCVRVCGVNIICLPVPINPFLVKKEEKRRKYQSRIISLPHRPSFFAPWTVSVRQVAPVSLPHGPYLFARSLQFLCHMDRICSRGRSSFFAPWTVSVREVAPVSLRQGPYLFSRSLQFICDRDRTSSRCNVAAVSP